MITINVRRIARLKGIERPYTFLTKRGFTHHIAKQFIAGSVKRLHFGDLEKLCRVFQCEPYDLYDYQVPSDLVQTSTDPLAFLKKNEPAADIQAIIRSLSLKQMEDLAQEVAQRYRAA